MKAHRLILSAVFSAILCSCGASYQAAELANESDSEAINTGYGHIKRRDVTGSVSKVKMGDDAFLYTDIYDYLRGRVAGLDVQGSGSNAVIRIRGERTILGSNDPLILVDGIEMSDISTIPPSEVQSVEVLKDASMTAAYGVRGANGVILISLKHE